MASKLDPHKTQIEAMLQAGESVNTVAQTFGVARSTAQDYVRKYVQLDLGTGQFQDDRLVNTPGTGVDGIPVVHRDYSGLDSLHVYPLGDIHLGSPNCAEAVLDEWLQYIVDTEGVSLLNTGDNLNSAIKDSVSDVYAEEYTVQVGRQKLTEKFRPVAEAGKLDAIIDGNHEWRILRTVGDSPNSAVADALGVAYSPAALYVVYHVGDQEYGVYLRHGNGGGTTMGAAVNRLEKQERIVDADCYISGHTHTQVAFPKETFFRDGERMVRRKRMFVSSGSFLGYEDYAKIAGYPPAHIGAPRIFLDGRKHDVHASV
jgi:hypothetical protein